jgi:ubiquinone/menaquinone biosynthesis C-methylase UbiE
VKTEPPDRVAAECRADEPPAILQPPPGRSAVPAYDRGWLVDAGKPEPFLSYLQIDPSVNWSAELEALHEESSRTHFIDQWTRRTLVQSVGPLAARATIADIGCSTGFLLDDLRAAHPHANLIGVDLIASGLRKAHRQLPSALLLQADACALPIGDACIDAVVSANLLEHIPDDERALAEVSRVLLPGGRVAIAVPAGPSAFDYYDRFLGHERRYAPGELAAKCVRAGLELLDDLYVAALLYPAFWLFKQRNRRRYGHLQGTALETRVAHDIARTHDSRLGRLSWRLEDTMERAGLRLPFGIRSVVLARKPEHRS